jgi:hypothetical protein
MGAAAAGRASRKMGAEQITGLMLRMEEAKAWGRGEAEGDEGAVEEGRGVNTKIW